MAEVLGIVLVLILIFGTPMLARSIVRRASGSEGFMRWLNAYGPFPGRGRDESNDDTDA
jgi:hypothetical protein